MYRRNSEKGGWDYVGTLNRMEKLRGRKMHYEDWPGDLEIAETKRALDVMIAQVDEGSKTHRDLVDWRNGLEPKISPCGFCALRFHMDASFYTYMNLTLEWALQTRVKPLSEVIEETEDKEFIQALSDYDLCFGSLIVGGYVSENDPDWYMPEFGHDPDHYLESPEAWESAVIATRKKVWYEQVAKQEEADAERARIEKNVRENSAVRVQVQEQQRTEAAREQQKERVRDFLRTRRERRAVREEKADEKPDEKPFWHNW